MLKILKEKKEKHLMLNVYEQNNESSEEQIKWTSHEWLEKVFKTINVQACMYWLTWLHNTASCTAFKVCQVSKLRKINNAYTT